jgi:hypothetical protein
MKAKKNLYSGVIVISQTAPGFATTLTELLSGGKLMKKRIDWDKVAADQFKAMPADFQDDWRDLRNIVIKRR